VFQTNLGYIARPCPRTTKQNKEIKILGILNKFNKLNILFATLLKHILKLSHVIGY
jgi:hypothetical protein